MAEDEPPKPDPEHLARFRRVMTAIVAVPKNEVMDALTEKYKGKTLRLDSKGQIRSIKKK